MHSGCKAQVYLHALFEYETDAVDSLSEQLYQKSTHFLLELIQNADDNSYEAAIPTLTLRYERGGLRVDCNETGFTDLNVDALCRVGASSKVGINRTGRYIGQKGIGFKSVFKAADRVWISSRGYSFKFEKKNPLGMITPIWADFPPQAGTAIKNQTSFYLQLSEDYDSELLVKGLKSIDARVLIFLRNLKQIDVTVVEKDGKTWRRCVSKIDSGGSATNITKLKQDGHILEYIVSRHSVKQSKDGSDDKSEVLLAFPIIPPEAELPPQQVYAFLPIRDYSFTVSLIAIQPPTVLTL